MDPTSQRLFMAASQELKVGDFYQGGYFAGYISHTANGVPTHGLIVAPAASGYATNFAWKTSQTTTSGTSSVFDGLANTNNMNTESHPAARYCGNLSIGGFTDWYLPAKEELDIAYQNLKPTSDDNNASFGINEYSVPPRATNRTSAIPGITTATVFQQGGAEAFATGIGDEFFHWSSTEEDAETGSALRFSDGSRAEEVKTFGIRVRAFRRFAL